MMTGHPALAPRMAAVKSSPIAAVSEEARRLRAAGRPIVNLGEGELDFDTPPHVRQAAVRAIERGATKYTATSGTPELKAAIRRKFERENSLVYTNRQIIASTGAKQPIFNAFLATVAQGDEVIVPAPYWVSYPDMVRLAGGLPVIAPTERQENFKLSAATLAATVTPRTKWLILNSPNNPTGALYGRDDLVRLAEVVRRHPRMLVLADDIYERIVFDGPFATFAEIAPDLQDRILTVNGVSKSFSMTGWRLGYAAGPAWLIAALEVLQSQSTSNPSSISQAAAIEALEGPQDFLDGWITRLRAHREIVLEAIGATQGVLAANRPQAAFYVFASCSGAIGAQGFDGTRIGTDVDMASYILRAAGVAVVPGAAFGHSPYLRIAYAIDQDLLHQACDQIVRACRALGT